MNLFKKLFLPALVLIFILAFSFSSKKALALSPDDCRLAANTCPASQTCKQVSNSAIWECANGSGNVGDRCDANSNGKDCKSGMCVSGGPTVGYRCSAYDNGHSCQHNYQCGSNNCVGGKCQAETATKFPNGYHPCYGDSQCKSGHCSLSGSNSGGTCTTTTTSNPCVGNDGTKYKGGVCSGSKLYQCDGNGTATSHQTCANGCQVNTGKEDSCKTDGNPPPSNKCTKDVKITLNPDPATGKIGDQQPVTVTVQNNDSGNNCPSSDDYTLTKSLGNHLKGDFDTTKLTVSKGGTKTAKLTLKAKSGSGTKTYSISADGNNHAKVTKTGQFTIQGGGGNGNPTDTNTPTPTQGGGHHHPSDTPTPTIACTNPQGCGGGGGNTKLNVTIGIDGFGVTPNVPLGGNKNPVDGYSSRTLHFSLYNTDTNALTWSGDQSVSLQSDGKFHATFPVTGVDTHSYNFYAVGAPYVNTRVKGSITVNKGQTNQVSSADLNMPTGNVNDNDQSENKIDILDYNVIISCWIYSQDTSACDASDSNMANADLNGDGEVDDIDYTLFLKEFGIHGAVLPDSGN